MKAFCKACRHPLVKSSKFKDKLECSFCQRAERRKIADDYGTVSEF